MFCTQDEKRGSYKNVIIPAARFTALHTVDMHRLGYKGKHMHRESHPFTVSIHLSPPLPFLITFICGIVFYDPSLFSELFYGRFTQTRVVLYDSEYVHSSDHSSSRSPRIKAPAASGSESINLISGIHTVCPACSLSPQQALLRKQSISKSERKKKVFVVMDESRNL